MDGFVDAYTAPSRTAALPMGYYDDRDLPYYWNVADNYVLFDRFFASAHGGQRLEPHVLGHGHARQPGVDSIPPEGFNDLPTIFDRLEAAGHLVEVLRPELRPDEHLPQPGDGDSASQTIWVPLLAYARYIDDPELFSHIVDMDEYYKDAAGGHAAGRGVHRARRIERASPGPHPGRPGVHARHRHRADAQLRRGTS